MARYEFDIKQANSDVQAIKDQEIRKLGNIILASTSAILEKVEKLSEEVKRLQRR